MNSLSRNSHRERRFLSRLSVLIACGGLLAAPLLAQQASASDGFDVISLERTELDDNRQFLDLYLKLGNEAEAERYAKKILASDSKGPDALSALLGIHLKRRSAKSALSYAQRYAAVRPGGEADAMLAGALRLNGAKHEALAIMLHRYVKVPRGDHFPQLLELGYCYYDCRKIEEARGCLIKVRDDKRFSAKERAEAVNELAAIKREEDIREAYLAIEQRDLKRARRIANEVAGREKKPNRDVTALLAVLDADQHGKVDQAVATFEKLKASHTGSEPFPYQSTYAIFLLDQGRYAQAEAAAAEAASARSPFLTAEDAQGKLDTMRMIREYSRSVLSVKGTFQSQNEGNAYRAKFEASTPFNEKRTRAGVEYQFSELDFDSARPAGADETDYDAVYATLSHQLTGSLTARAAAGAVAGEFAYRVALQLKRPSKGDSLEIIFASGQRPTDSMTLEAFGAEENRATFKGTVEVPSHRRLTLSGEAFFRDIHLDHPLVDKLGTGWGARWEAEYLFYKFQRTALSAAYVGSFEEFDYSADARAARNLRIVEDDLHRHGILLRGRAALGANLTAHVELGADYRFDDKMLSYSASAGLEWWISQYTRLNASGAYYTSGLAGNAGSGYFEGQVGVSSSF